ncbi:MAG: alpha/beta hydrolase [Solirubrobacterales bacterium]|nr:alpha/beta hydrolase [Solirubrobacterales bacterium]
MSLRKVAVLVAASLSLGFAIAGCEVTVESGTDDFKVEEIPLEGLAPCDGPGMPQRMLCGSVNLPLEREDPDLGLINIAFAVLPATSPPTGERKGILGIEGGPGYGSIGSAALYRNLLGDVLRTRDLITIDARGTGESEAIDCPDLQHGTTSEEIGLAACVEQLGERFGSYRTSAIVDDFASVLDALGYEKVDVYGDSYGTFAAQSFAFRHPDRVRRIALDSAYPVRGESAWYPSIWQTGIRSLETVCDRTPGCSDASERLDEFVKRLRQDGYSTGPFLDLLAGAGYSPPGSYRDINEIVAADLAGNSAPYFEATRQSPAASGPPEAYSVGMEKVVSCNDYPMLWNKESPQADRYPELLAEVRNYPADAFKPFTPREIALSPEFLYLECLVFPGPDRFYEPPAGEDAEAPDVPVLIVNGELDNVTSPEEGRATADLFPDSRLFVVPNAGHTYPLSYPGSVGAREIRDFLR